MTQTKPPARVSRSKEEAKSSYDKLSRWYDLLAWHSEGEAIRRGLLVLDVQPGETVLEVGFGTGHALEILAQKTGPAGKICGIDISEGMTEVARQRLDEAGLADRVALQVGDAAELVYEDSTFDALFMSFTLELFDTPEIPEVLQECRRVLRDDGRIGVVAIASMENPNLMTRLYEWAHRTFPKWVDCRPIPARKLLAENRFQIVAREEMSMWGLPVGILLGKKAS